MRYNLLWLLICCGALTAHAQNVVSGTVIDSLTREPIPFASVYFANTTHGTTTDKDGKFTLSGFASGKYDLTVSFIGYYTQQRSLSFQNSVIMLRLSLLENATQLAEIVVSPDTTNRHANLVVFRSYFIGNTRNAQKTKIRNQDELDFDFDDRKRVFTAFSRKPLEIVNEALGYKIFFDLYTFEIDYANSRSIYLGIPRFENISLPVKARWKRERKRAYYGSFTHFIRMLQADSLDDFEVNEFFRKRNPQRPSEEVLKAKINYWRELQTSHTRKITVSGKKTDSLSYYASLRQLPEFVDSLGQKITSTRTLINENGTKITYTGMLWVVYKKEREEDNYAFSSKRAPQARQYSIIHIVEPITLYSNGYYEKIESVFFEGYMGWSEKIAELLPLGYLASGGEND